MSTDRTTEILNYLSAISRDVGELRTGLNSLRTEVSELRTEMNARFSEVNTRLGSLERRQRLHGRRLERIEGLLQTTRADIDELQGRVDTLEGK